MILSLADRDTNGLLDETTRLEVVAINQRADERTLSFARHIHAILRALRRVRAATVSGLSGLRFGLIITEAFIYLAVDEEVGHNPARTPVDTIGPALNVGARFAVDENRTGNDEVRTVSIRGPPFDEREVSIMASRKQD